MMVNDGLYIYTPSEETRLQENHTLAASENLADGNSLRHEQRCGATKRTTFFLCVDGLVVNFWLLTFSSIDREKPWYLMG